ncbi:hypothetical protein AMS68_007683 [Peltaster fructicola]|uniref:GTPase-activating protein GYP7 n=1 Tax=Peltaster fructicola TaxID=286661 RepID=A0A6H0Y5C2_9PEZI|nr:hypothetical protein AMS68_007683 [Peltaster fructicola]
MTIRPPEARHHVLAGEPQRAPSPAGSFEAMSDEDEGEYSTIRSSRGSRGVKLLNTKSKVYQHPSPSAKDNVVGWVVLMEQKPALLGEAGTRQSASTTTDVRPSSSGRGRADKSNLLLGWVPESGIGDAANTYNKVETASSEAPRKGSNLVPAPPVTTVHSSNISSYAFTIPLSDIYSILFRPPSAGWWHGSIVINTRTGDSFPPLFFHDSECQSTIQERKRLQRETFSISTGETGRVFWGGDEVLKWLKQHVNMERSTHEPSCYLVDPSEADKLNFGAGGKPTADNVRNILEGKHKDEPMKQPAQQGLEALSKALKETRWQVLEKLSQVTTFTRRTAQAVADNKNLPPHLRRLMQNPQVQSVSDEFDSARLYLARWARSIAEQSEKERSQRIWSAKDVLEMEESDLGSFEILDLDAQGLSLSDRRSPVTLKEWNGFFNATTGRLERTVDEVKERIFHGGLSPDDGVRKEAWLFLLGVHDWDSTAEDRKVKIMSLRDEYVRLKGAWWERLVDETGTLEEREWWKEQRMRIEKDVHRTDRHIPLFAGEDIPHPDPDSPFSEQGTNVHLEQMKDMLLTYNEYNRDLGYVQGMSDLLAPLYAVEQDDAVAFWAFVGFMDRMERNYLRDQSGMRLQLNTLDQLCQLLDPKLYEHLQRLDSTNFFFFFRMLLVWFKREFEFDDIMRLWESLWTDYLSANFHLFIAMAILEKHRDVIMEHLKGFDEVLKYVNELSGTIDLPSTMVKAEGLFRRFQKTVETIDKKNNFPSAPVPRQRLPQPPTESTPDKAKKPTASTSAREQTTTEQTAGQSAKEQIISPELRSLLSREFPKLEKKEVREHGGGVGS